MTKLAPVKSSMLSAVGHDPATNTLTVEFVNGGRYEYPGVTASHHAELMAAPSIGKHLNTVVRGIAGPARKVS